MSKPTWTGHILLKCREGHITRTFVGKYFWNGYAEDGKTIIILRDHRTPCVVCGRPLITERGQLLNGALNPAVKCSPKCQGATRNVCECACGGDNHGGAHDSPRLMSAGR